MDQAFEEFDPTAHARGQGSRRPQPETEEEPLFPSSFGDDGDDGIEGQDELYAILNLSKDCTEDEIQKSFKRLATLLHPDRHRDPALKSSADSRFQALQRAYEVLSNPHTRAIYDELGAEGLATNAARNASSNWQVGQKTKTPQELREEFEKNRRKQREVEVDALVKSKGELTCTTDARVLFLPDDERRRMGGPHHLSLVDKLGTISTNQMFLKHSFTTPINDKNSLTFTSQLLARKGAGGGNMIIKLISRPISTLALEASSHSDRKRYETLRLAVTFKSTYSPDLDTFAIFETAVRQTAVPPPFTVTLGRRISDTITATFAIRSGIYNLGPWGRDSLEPLSSSSISLSLISTANYSVTTTLGLISSNISADWATTALGGVKVRVGGSVSTEGAVGTYVSGDRRVTEFSRVGMGLQLDQGGIMTFKVSWSRLGQKVSLPIIISSNLQPMLALSFTVLPTVSVMAINHYIVDPRRKNKVSSRIAELRKEHEEYISEKKKEAEDAIALLAENSRKRMDAEAKANGLVVLEALYGVLSSEDRVLDVTVPIQSLVSNSQLTIVGGRGKSSLLGFYDVAIGEKKSLRIKYLFKGREHVVEVSDREAVAAPIRAHLVQ